MSRTSREKTEENRSKIVDAAYHLFVDKGYNAASMRDISWRSGLTVGAIYNHFVNKEELWKEVVLTKHPYRDIIKHIHLAPGDTLADVLRFAAGALVKELDIRPDLLNLMFIEIVEFKGKHIPDLYNLVIHEIHKLRHIVDGKPDKIRQIPIPILLRSFIGLFFSYYITGILYKNIPSMTIDNQSLDLIIDLFLYGLMADDDPTRSANFQPGCSINDLLSP